MIGNGVLKVELEVVNGVPELVVNAQFTLVGAVMLLPVEMNVNKTLDPEQTFRFEPTKIGLVEKFAFNCPSTFNERKQTTVKTRNLRRVENIFKSCIF